MSISAYDIAPEGQPELADISHDMPPETPVFYNSKPDDERERVPETPGWFYLPTFHFCLVILGQT